MNDSNEGRARIEGIWRQYQEHGLRGLFAVYQVELVWGLWWSLRRELIESLERRGLFGRLALSDLFDVWLLDKLTDMLPWLVRLARRSSKRMARDKTRKFPPAPALFGSQRAASRAETAVEDDE